MALRDRFPFSAIFKVIDKVVEIAGLVKLILAALQTRKKDGK